MRTPNPSKDQPIQLPALHRYADAAATRDQHEFLLVTRIRLGLLVSVAALANCSIKVQSVDVPAILAAVGFGSLILLEGFQLRRHPERGWYRGRALAESVKTITWRYAMRAVPFDSDDADATFLSRISKLQIEFSDATLLNDNGSLDLITPDMRMARQRSVEDRRARYLAQRIDDQIWWYSDKAEWNRAQAKLWAIGLGLVNVGGLAAAVLRATGVLTFDMMGVLGALATAGFAWSRAKQFDNLAVAYSTTHTELTMLRQGLQLADEAAWPTVVSDAEEAISREHTAWQASRAERSTA